MTLTKIFECELVKETANCFAYKQTNGEEIGRIYLKKYCYLNTEIPKSIKIVIS